MMKCPTCGGPLKPSKKDPDYLLCYTCKKKFKVPQHQAEDVAPKTERMSAKKEAGRRDSAKKDSARKENVKKERSVKEQKYSNIPPKEVREKQEREIFLLLISVSGIGGNTARMILSALSPAELVNVISTENANMLKTVKGIGLKTAQRVIVDLKDKIKTMSGSAGGGASAGLLLQPANAEVQEEAVSALTMLGFAAAPSQKVVLAILKEEPDAPVEKVIKLALKRL